MEKSTSMGLNRTGTQRSPLASRSMQAYADDHLPPGMIEPDGGIAQVRTEYVQEAERVGSVPLPATLTGAATTGMAMLTGKRPEVLVDKLGERLAFERGGVRLYEALIDKAAVHDATAQPLPFTLDELRHIRDEELEHMHIVISAIESIGADPTAQTPSADVVGVTAMGIMQVLTDPRTTLPQSLTAILSAELTDHASWELLLRLAEELGRDELLEPLRHALHQEEQHVVRVRGWLSQLVLDEAA